LLKLGQLILKKFQDNRIFDSDGSDIETPTNPTTTVIRI
jgi:hypothetical protein